MFVLYDQAEQICLQAADKKTIQERIAWGGNEGGRHVQQQEQKLQKTMRQRKK